MLRGYYFLTLQILIHKSDQTKIYACELPFLRMVWEDVSSVLEMLQTNRDCVAEEYSHLGNASLPSDYRINFTTAPMDLSKFYCSFVFRVTYFTYIQVSFMSVRASDYVNLLIFFF